MALNSINTNIAAYNAQSNIGKASTQASSSIARLSSGDRIVRAADDVAAMSAGTSLRTNVTTLKMALINTSQGASLLQVADGALSQITDILQRQKAIAVQSGSGSLSAAERGFLNQEFQNLSQEIDRLAKQTNFNGVGLLDGSLSEKVDVVNNGDAAISASGSISFNINVTAGQTLSLNGTTVTEGTGWVRGSSIQSSLDNLVTFLNSSTDANLSQASYSRDGNSLVITAKAGGVQSQDYRINMAGGTWTNTANAAVINGATASATFNLFAAGKEVAAASVNDVVVAGTTTATQPIGAGIITVKATNLANAAVTTIGTRVVGMSLQDMVDDINSNTATTGVTARITGRAGAYNIQLEHNAITATAASAQMTVAAAGNNAAVGTVPTNTTTVINQVFSLQGGNDLGIGAGDTVGVGVIGNNIITGQTQTKAKVQLIFPEIASGDLLSAANFGATTPMGITVGGATFTFSNGGGDTEIAVGATLEETLDNAAAAINSYRGSGSVNYVLDQITVRREGTSLIFEGADVGNITDAAGAGVTLAIAGTPVTGSSLTNAGALNNSVNSGVSTSGVTNDGFIGKIGGFTATYTGTTDQVDLSVTVGGHTYTARVTDTTPSANSTIRLNSQDGGGYFDIQLSAGNGQAVSSQSAAELFSQRVNAAFESLTFYQSRAVSSYTGNTPIITDGVVTGSLIGTSVELQQDSFEAVSIDQIRVNAPVGSNPNGSISMVVNGVTYTSASNIGSSLGANQTYKLTSAENSSEFITFTTGDVAIQFDTAAKAASFQSALEKAFGVGSGAAELAFQVGVTTADTLSVGIENVTTYKIYGGEAIDVLTKESASRASDVLDLAIDKVTSVRAEVGALQSRFDFAAANVESSLQNQDAARGVLLDTDIASESTAYATAQVQLQAGIAVLAQANLLPQNLLKLIG